VIGLLLQFWRHLLVLILLMMLFGLIGARAIKLQVTDRDFLQSQGEARMERVDSISASRGMILDRNGEPLAVSAPLTTLWADPRLFGQENVPELAKALGVTQQWLSQRTSTQKSFVYLKRHMVPEDAAAILDLKMTGVFGQIEYKRFYPAGEVTAQIIGLTNVDEAGQEGIELAFNDVLEGEDGKKRVLKDLYGRTVRDVESIKAVSPGENLYLTVDQNLQYLAYRELKAAVTQYHATAGSLVMMDVTTGEILAMVNQPSFNPNNRANLVYAQARNRSVTDAIEPGSVVKALTLAAALESGKLKPTSEFNTSPGYRRYDGHTIRDTRDYGKLSMTDVLVKSSNIGASEIALTVGGEEVWKVFYDLGLGQVSGIGLPGESAGLLPNRPNWKDIETATFSYGYGLTVTPLQLVVAYAAIANNGVKVQPMMIRDGTSTVSKRVLSESTATKMQSMLEQVVLKGTGRAAQSALYRIAGKTGTSHKVGPEGYNDNRYVGTFAGFAPVSNPRLAMILIIDDPQGEKYYGGEIAAPAFGRIMEAALQLLNVAPDQALSDGAAFVASELEVAL
jgi:cell division protein FtsI (penicillin-binding protein 3)